VLHRAVVESGALVGAGAVVPNDMVVPSRAMALGVPAKLRPDSVDVAETLRNAAEYVRNGEHHTTLLTPERDQSDYGPVGRAGIGPMIEPVIAAVDPGSPAARAGFRAGDRIVAANNKPVTQLTEFFHIVDAAKNKPVLVEVQRGSGRALVRMASEKSLEGFLTPFKVQQYALPDAIRYSIKENSKMLRYTFVSLGRLFRPEGSIKELSGIPTIARIAGEMLRRGWVETIGLMAMISLQLGIMNLLPIPVLDGGHIFILLVEGIARRDFSLRMKEHIQQAGFPNHNVHSARLSATSSSMLAFSA